MTFTELTRGPLTPEALSTPALELVPFTSFHDAPRAWVLALVGNHEREDIRNALITQVTNMPDSERYELYHSLEAASVANRDGDYVMWNPAWGEVERALLLPGVPTLTRATSGVWGEERLPEVLLKLLALSPVARARQHLSSYPYLTREFVEWMAEHVSKSTIMTTLRNPALSEQDLRAFMSRSWVPLPGVASNRNASSVLLGELLLEAFRREDWVLLDEVLRNPNAGDDVVRLGFGVGECSLLGRFVARARFSEVTAREFLGLRLSAFVFGRFAGNESLSDGVLLELVGWGDPEVSSVVAGRVGLSDGVALRLLGCVPAMLELVGNSSVSTRVLEGVLGTLGDDSVWGGYVSSSGGLVRDHVRDLVFRHRNGGVLQVLQVA